MPTLSDLQQKQALPLEAKVAMSRQRIREFYEALDGNVYISSSGGKDSVVLTHLVRSVYPKVPIFFMDTGLEFPESRALCREQGAKIIRPMRSFVDVITQYGYPVISKEVSECIYYARRILNGKKNKAEMCRTTLNKRKELLGERVFVDDKEGVSLKTSRYNKTKWFPLSLRTDFMISNRCCFYIKKSDFEKINHDQGLHPYIGTTTEESVLRREAWIRHGCNTFRGSKAVSRPISFWREQDILRYIVENNLKYSPVYGDIVWDEEEQKYRTTKQRRTGCIFCAYAVNYSIGSTKFLELAKWHPKQYEYCLEGGRYIPNPHYDPDAPVMDGEWENWNPKRIWVPSRKGIGMRHVFDQLNEIYGKDFIKY